ncbi:MAG: hypothetical protein ACO3O6_12865, partial [Gemmobacter sp.]
MQAREAARDPVRAGALGLLRGVLEQGASIGDQVAAGALGALDPAGRARAQRLALGALRGIAAAEAALAPHLARKPEPALHPARQFARESPRPTRQPHLRQKRLDLGLIKRRVHRAQI